MHASRIKEIGIAGAMTSSAGDVAPVRRTTRTPLSPAMAGLAASAS
jgi:hypothetical protein